jgi:hypothetical protein
MYMYVKCKKILSVLQRDRLILFKIAPYRNMEFYNPQLVRDYVNQIRRV